MEELNQQLTAQESPSPENESPVQEESYEQETQQQEQESIQAKNFRELRTQAEKYKRERDELLQHLQQQQQSSNQRASSDDQEDIQLNPDDLVEGKHLSSYGKKIKKLEEQLKKYEQSSQEQIIESRLKNNDPDFDRVVNKQTVDVLREQFPELYSTIASSSDLYGKGATAYTLIKRLGLIVDEATQHDQTVAQKNLQKPRTLTSIAKSNESPLSRAHAFDNGLTDDLKKSLWKEMNDLRKGY